MYTNLFSDQFAFRPTGSTTAAIIYLTQAIAKMLEIYPYVHLISLDFSKAFDTVRHSTLLQKSATMPIPDEIYNWTVDYLNNREHCTRFNGITSSSHSINASIVQGSGIGPVEFVINASDLHPITQLNEMGKYADDSYLLVPSVNTNSITAEIDHIAGWAATNNLTLNTTKTKELMLSRPKFKKSDLPPLVPGIVRVESLNVLGVIFQDKLSFNEHVKKIVCKCAQGVYALRTLKAHGLSGTALWDVAEASILSSALYASQAWWGMIDASCKKQLEAVLRKIIKQGFLSPSHISFSEACNKADITLFETVLKNPHHVLHHLLTPIRTSEYNFRRRAHNRQIPTTKNTLLLKTYLIRMLCLNSY